MIAPNTLLNSVAWVTLDNGQELIKVIRKGSELGKWTLESYNASYYPPIENVAITEARPFRSMRAN